jgi:ABC-type uncharacterized transport system permease subunit
MEVWRVRQGTWRRCFPLGLGAFDQGLAHADLALGTDLTLRVLNLIDLTVDGAFAHGG